MTTHPSEPWHVVDGFGIQAADLRRVDICHLATADRIVACVNACAGMADPDAEIADLRQLQLRSSPRLKAPIKEPQA